VEEQNRGQFDETKGAFPHAIGRAGKKRSVEIDPSEDTAATVLAGNAGQGTVSQGLEEAVGGGRQDERIIATATESDRFEAKKKSAPCLRKIPAVVSCFEQERPDPVPCEGGKRSSSERHLEGGAWEAVTLLGRCWVRVTGQLINRNFPHTRNYMRSGTSPAD